MDDNLFSSVFVVCKVLNKNSVQYMIVGGAAVALHGYFRKSLNFSGSLANKPDLDFWYNPGYNNYFRLLNALAELGQDVSEFKDEVAPNPKKSFFKLEFEKFTLDFLPELKGLSKFSLSFKERETANIDDTEISFLSYNDLIKNKQVNARPKDMIDIEQLKNKKKEN